MLVERLFDTVLVVTLGGVIDANEDVVRLSTAVDDCFDTPLSCLSAQEISDRLVAFNNISARMDALRVETVAAAKAIAARLSD